MMHPATTQALVQARLADLHREAGQAASVRAARQARPARSQPAQHSRGILAAVLSWARRSKLEPES